MAGWGLILLTSTAAPALPAPETMSTPELLARTGILVDRWGVSPRCAQKAGESLSEHPFSPSLDSAERARLDVGPLLKGGDGSAPHPSADRTADFRQIGGPSTRVGVDVGQREASVAVNHPAHGGNPYDPHARDPAESGRHEEDIPLLFARSAVPRKAERIDPRVPVP